MPARLTAAALTLPRRLKCLSRAQTRDRRDASISIPPAPHCACLQGPHARPACRVLMLVLEGASLPMGSNVIRFGMPLLPSGVIAERGNGPKADCL
jgi:hypothetical protein